jgi:serpin B
MCNRLTALSIALVLAAAQNRYNGEAKEPPDVRPNAVQTGDSPFTHVLATSTEYYRNGPQQMRPADGRLLAGTRVTLIRSAGSYSLVRTDNLQVYVATSSLRPSSPENEERLQKLVAANNQFAFDLFNALRAEGQGNLFFSPYSLSAALGMVYAGARGETARQIAHVLHCELPEEQLAGSFQALAQILAAGAGRGYELASANRLWGQEGYRFVPAYLELTRRYYGAPLASVDFARQTEQARGEINRWVEQQTRNKIADLIPPGALKPMTRLVLTNAVYFRGDWTEPFKKDATKESPFKMSAERRTPVPLMHQQERFRYAAFDDFQLLDLPYGNEDLAMLVILPRRIDGLASVESSLSPDALQSWIRELVPQEVNVFLPRFKLTAQFELSRTLAELGMPAAFSQAADFSGIATAEELMLAAVLHKAYVDVNEKGTEAAAATGIIVAPTAAAPPAEIPIFRADHPFLFLIRDLRTESILFIGRLLEPKG